MASPEGSPIEGRQAPAWVGGQWWEYHGSDGIAYVYSFEAKELKERHETLSVRINLSELDERGTRQYVNWYAASNLGIVAGEQGPIHIGHDCPAGAWFPLEQHVEDDCGTTRYCHGNFLERYDEKSAKIPTGWENLSVPAGRLESYKFYLQDRASNRTYSTRWYCPQVQNRVQWIGDDGITYRLVAWGAAQDEGAIR